MEHPDRLSVAELNRTLELMGLNKTSAGSFSLFLDQKNSQRRLMFHTEGWEDIPTADILGNLERNGFDIEKFWQSYEKLFQTPKS